MFSQPIEQVSDTSIFARAGHGRQVLVYSMKYSSERELAMVLPIPVPPNSPDEAVAFINLERYPEFFSDLSSGFHGPALHVDLVFLDVAEDVSTLQVHEVGAFEASFVPSIADFVRLDERFRLPAPVWDGLPMYQDYGFAVFKLKDTGASALAVHPMAFEFPQRDPDLLFFPTVHVHDTRLHPTAHFNHSLYCQLAKSMYKHVRVQWEQSSSVASAFVDPDRAAGLVNGDQPCWRRPLDGLLTNEDTWVGARGSVPHAAAH